MARAFARLFLATLLLAVAACGGGQAAEPGAQPSPPAAAPQRTPGASDEPSQPPSSASPDAVASAWVEALAAGDLDSAWALLSDDARAAVGGREGFDALSSALAEGWGSWAAAEPQTRVLNVPSADADEAGVVVLAGERMAEGITETVAGALPYVVRDGELRLEPFVGTVTWETPAEHGATLPSDAPVAATVPAGDVFIAVDDDVRVAHTEPGPQQGTIRASLPLGDVAAGEHVVTVVSATPDGLVADARLAAVA